MTRGLLTACLPGLPPAETAGWSARDQRARRRAR